MKILIAGFGGTLGGTEKYARALVDGLGQSYEAVGLTSSSSELAKRAPTATGRRWVTLAQTSQPARDRLVSPFRELEHVVPTGLRTSLSAGTRLRRAHALRTRIEEALRREAPDVVLVQNGGLPGSPWALATAFAAGTLRIPCLMTIHTTPVAKPPLAPLVRAMETAVVDSRSVLITVSTEARRALIARGFSPKRTIMVPTGIDRPQLVDRDHARALLGVPTEDPVVVFLGNFLPPKRHDLFIRAIERVRAEGLPLHGVLAGAGPRKDRYLRLVRRRNLHDVVHLVGHVDPALVLSAADALVLASDQEGTPLSILEAMASRVPVVASRVGGIPELLALGQGGLLAYNTPLAFAAALLDTFQNREATAERTAFSAARFDEQHLIDQMLSLYAGLIDRYGGCVSPG